MADSRFKPIKEDELASIVDRAIHSSVGFYDSKLSKERQEVIDYYNGKKPAPLHSGNSKYVSHDVFDAVESLKAVLLETFSAGNRIVSFDPQNEDDVPMAKVATDYTDYVVHRQNDGYHVFGTVIHDGLTARTGVVKVYWDEQFEEVTEVFEASTLDEVDMLAADPAIENISIEMGDDGIISGELTRKVNKSQVRIEPIPPEEFLITPQAKSIAEAPFVGHRTRKTYSDLLKMGFDKKKVSRIGAEDDHELSMDPEVLARFDQTGTKLGLEGEVQEQSKYLMVYECYMYLDMQGDGKTKLHKIIKCGNVVLDHEEVDTKPFLSFTPLPVPHSFFGNNYAQKVIPTQNARTTLVRGILDHTVITNNARFMVVKGSVTNPKELIENRVGGLVNVTRPDGIIPFPQTGLNPFVFQTIQLLDEDKEEVTGVSKLSQGMNKDAISKQNSAGMVENLVSLSQQREKIIARNFAQFVKALYLEVYRLVLANETEEKVIAVAGEFVPITPAQWSERTDCTVELKLGYGEQEREAQKLMMLHQFISQDPKAQPFYDLPNAHAMYRAIFDKHGIKNVTEFIKPVEQVKPPQPDPMLIKQMELEERKIATQEVIAKAQQDKVAINAELEQMRVQIEQMRAQMEASARERELDRKEFEIQSKNAIAVEELEMAKKQQAQSPENTTAIVSPNS